MNPNLVAVDRKGTARFKPHFQNKQVSRVMSVVNGDIDEDMEDDDAEELYDDYTFRGRRLHSRERRCVAVIACRAAEREGRGAVGRFPRASSPKGPHNTKFFKVWGPHKVNQQ